jgi:hypothetical protein
MGFKLRHYQQAASIGLWATRKLGLLIVHNSLLAIQSA